MRQRRRLTWSLFLLACSGCPDSDSPSDAGDSADTGQQTGDLADTGETGAPCPLDCGDHGSCVPSGELFDCDCDPGYEAQGLTCIDPEGSTAPPADFDCPSPGDLATPDAQRLVGASWAYLSNDRTCELSSASIYNFGADGIFTRHFQAKDAVEGGTLVYGCWSLEGDDAGMLDLLWDHASDDTLNCGFLAGLADPPDCETSLVFDSARDAWVVQGPLESGEVHLLHPSVSDCTWCTDAPECCPHPSWVEADGEPLCD